MTTTASPTSDALAQVVTRLSTVVGSSRLRQLRWIVGELEAYQAEHTASGRTAPDLATLFSPAWLEAFLTAADAGSIRTRTSATYQGRPSPLGTRKVRRTCLHMLAAAANLPVPDLPGATGHVRPLWTTDLDARRAVAVLVEEAQMENARPALVRTAFVAALVHCHDLRVGEIAALDTAALDLGPNAAAPGTLTYVPDPPGDSATRAPSTVYLAPPAWTMARRWLPIRERLVARHPYADRTPALLVSVHGNHDGDGVRRPAGLPVVERGLTKAHTRAVAHLNTILAERHGHDPDWQPLPRTLGSLRPKA